MRILVAGNSGQVACSLAELSSEKCEIIAVGRPELDLLDASSISAAIERTAPNLIINAAAYTAVDQAESDKAAAFALNCDGADQLAVAAAAGSIPLIHISTDYVFDGKGETAYREADPVAPSSIYGKSKLAGEQAVIAAQPMSLIVRTAWVVSPFGKNFCKTMLRLAQGHPKLRVVDDQIGSPTYAPHLAAALVEMGNLAVAKQHDAPWGIYHLANRGSASWCDVAKQTMTAAEKAGLASVPVEAITTAEFPTPAPRPANSRLDCGKAEANFGIVLADWKSAIDDCVQRLARQ
ncbi:MAG: dTDP-4-dehydrorhamnose reductase [Pseudomonadota bacterium]